MSARFGFFRLLLSPSFKACVNASANALCTSTPPTRLQRHKPPRRPGPQSSWSACPLSMQASRSSQPTPTRLHADDLTLISVVAAANPQTVVVVIAGGTVVVDPWDGTVAAVLLAWYRGMEGGRAIADLLLGNAEPGGRLPMALPHRQADLPTVDWTARHVTYGRWWGQRKLDRDGTPRPTRSATDSATRASHWTGFGWVVWTENGSAPLFRCTTPVPAPGDMSCRSTATCPGIGSDRYERCWASRSPRLEPVTPSRSQSVAQSGPCNGGPPAGSCSIPTL